MQIQETKPLHPLAEGQMWKLEHGYLHIVELSKRLVQYKILRQLHQHVATSRLIGIVELIIFLRHNEAELMMNATHQG
ncbi:MAG: hypothetical protein WCT12_06070 [Verrucomicrobiota bacterium]